MVYRLHSRRPQRGIGTLAVSMLLLFAASITIFYLNRGLIFEQKTSANQNRSTAAFEVAEAGIEWATGMLNSTRDIDTNCNLLATSNISFRSKYIQMAYPAATYPVVGISGGNHLVQGTTFPGCKIDGTTLTCSCPAAGATASLGTANLPGFTVRFDVVPVASNGVTDASLPAGQQLIDAGSVRITAVGCTAQTGVCTAANATNSDATATISVIVKNVPSLRAGPQSALTCGTSCGVGGSYNIKNTEVASNGYLVDAGTAITSGSGTSYQTIPGQPIQNALVSNDTSLSGLSSNDTTCSNSNMFQAFFGVPLSEWAANPNVTTIPGCTDPSTCGAKIQAALDANSRASEFYFPDGMSLNNSAPFSTLGTPGVGVRLVSPAAININGNITINGLIFSNDSNFNDLGTGTADINGAIITCAAYNNNGNGLLNYDSSNLGNTGLGPGNMIRVPGSWKDF